MNASEIAKMANETPEVQPPARKPGQAARVRMPSGHTHIFGGEALRIALSNGGVIVDYDTVPVADEIGLVDYGNGPVTPLPQGDPRTAAQIAQDELDMPRPFGTLRQQLAQAASDHMATIEAGKVALEQRNPTK